MALVNCPECGRENVSDSARSCPGCGFDVKAYYAKEKHTSPVDRLAEKLSIEWYDEDEDVDELEDYEPESNLSAVRSSILEYIFHISTKNLTKRIIRQLPKHAEGNLLLLGYGNGSVVETLLKKTRCQIFGVDSSRHNYRRARKWNLTYLRGGRLQLMNARLNNLVLPAHSFRYILAPNSVYEMKSPAQGLQQLRRLLAEDGTLFLPCVSVESASFWNDTFYDFSADDLVQLAQEAGFELVERKNLPSIPGFLLKFQVASTKAK
jgi:ubiquinone/menaquinone biosynthesis C-methylase UbiE